MGETEQEVNLEVALFRYDTLVTLHISDVSVQSDKTQDT